MNIIYCPQFFAPTLYKESVPVLPFHGSFDTF